MIIRILKDIYHYLKLIRFQDKFRKINSHNYTRAENIFSLEKVIIGRETYGALNIREFGKEEEKLIIGSYCSIANDVQFLLSGEHYYKCLSTYPFKTKILENGPECICKGNIIIEDDVWIGSRVTILSGVRIGQGAIIGAGSIVAKDIPPYGIYANGKIIKYRFNDAIIKKLKKLNYNNLTKEQISQKVNLLYEDVTEENVDKIIKEINKKEDK